MTAPAAYSQVDGIAFVSVCDIPLLPMLVYSINIKFSAAETKYAAGSMIPL